MLMIICFCEDLWVINGVLTSKNIFDTNNVVYRVGAGWGQGGGVGELYDKTKKFEISSFKNFWV